MRIRGEPVSQGTPYSRFADAGLPGDEDNTTFTALRLLPPAQQQIELLLTAKQGRGPRLMLGLEPALDLAGPEHLMHMYAVRKTLQCVPSEIAVIEERTDQPVRDGRNDEGIGLGDCL